MRLVKLRGRPKGAAGPCRAFGLARQMKETDSQRRGAHYQNHISITKITPLSRSVKQKHENEL